MRSLTLVTVLAMTGVTTPVVWAQARFQYLPPLPGRANSFPTAASVNGSVVVGFCDGSGSSVRAFRWDSGVLSELHGPAGQTMAAQAYGVSADGSIIVGDLHTAQGRQAFRWTLATGMIGLGYLPGGDTSHAEAVSADGAVVVGWGTSSVAGCPSSCGSLSEAFRWTQATQMVGLGFLNGGDNNSSAFDVSADGSVIVGYGSSQQGYQGFRWANSTLTPLGDLRGGGFFSIARSVTSDGMTVFGESISGLDGTSDLKEWFRVSSGSLDGLGNAGQFTDSVRGSSNDGTVVVGREEMWDTVNRFRATAFVLADEFGLGAQIGPEQMMFAQGTSGDGRVVVGQSLSLALEHKGWIANLNVPAPANDDCAGARTITDGQHTGTTWGATPDATASCLSTPRKDVWFEYTATCDGSMHVSTCSSNHNTSQLAADYGYGDNVVTIYQGNVNSCPVGAGGEIGCFNRCDAPGCTDPSNACTPSDGIPVRGGSDYLIRVAGKPIHADQMTLDVRCEPSNDYCEDATALSASSSTLSRTDSASIDAMPTCGGVSNQGPGVWYSVVGTGNTLRASLCDGTTDFNARLSVFCSGCVDRKCVAANDGNAGCGGRPEVSWCSAPGTVYHILVHGDTDEATGRFRLQMTDEGTPCKFALSCTPANDACANATNITSFPFTGDNTGAGTSVTTDCQVTGQDVWYRYATACNGFATISTCDTPGSGSLADTVVTVFDECGGRELGCSDDAAGCDLRSKLIVPARAGGFLLIRVAGYGVNGSQGTFPMKVTPNPVLIDVPPPGFYVTNGEDGLANHLLRLDRDTDSVTDVGTHGVGAIHSLAYDSTAGYLYGVEVTTGNLYALNMRSGGATLRGAVGFGSVNGLAFDPISDTLYGSNLTSLLVIDRVTGTGAEIGNTGSLGVEGLAFDPNTQTLYGCDTWSNHLLTIDTATGVATPATAPFGPGVNRIAGLSFDTATNTLFGTDIGSPGSGDGLVVINTASGSASRIGGAYTDAAPFGLAIIQGLTSAAVEVPYAASIPVAGGCPGLRFSGFVGLPPELTAGANGLIYGQPTASGSFTVDFTVTDSDLSTPHINASLPLRVSPANDACGNATIMSEDSVSISNAGASTDGPDEPGICDFSQDTQVGSDLWYCYTASCRGTAIVSLCGSFFDTKMAVYASCACPSGAQAIACNDDQCGLQSELSFPVEFDQQFLIRVGGYAGAQGDGALTITCEGQYRGACCVSSQCHVFSMAQCLEMGGTFLGEQSSCTLDSDGDGTPSACDHCPDDPEKTDPGDCGCAVAETDSDGDGVPDCIDACDQTIPLSPVNAAGCPPDIFGDVDRDGDDDLWDYLLFKTCISGPFHAMTPECAAHDSDSDSDIDHFDFGIFQRCFSGQDVPGNPTCSN